MLLLPSGEGAESQVTSRVLRLLDEVQKQTNAQIVSVTPLETENLSFYKRITIRVEMEDSLEQILGFIRKIRESPEQLNVLNLNLVSGQKNGVLNASLTVAQLLSLK